MNTRLSRLALAFTALLAAESHAQEWPSRPVRVTVPALPSSGPVLTARVQAEHIGKSPGSPLVIVNKAGGLGIPALIELNRATPDGNSLLIGNINTNGLAPALHTKKYGFDVKSGIQPVTLLSDGPSALIASRAVPTTFRESLDLWKVNPGKYAYFGAGIGAFGHVATGVWTVGIKGCCVSAFGSSQVTLDEFGNFTSNTLREWIAGSQIPTCVNIKKLSVVVQHLFEMWHDPLAVHRIAREAATELVVHAPKGHSRACGLHHG